MENMPNVCFHMNAYTYKNQLSLSDTYSNLKMGGSFGTQTVYSRIQFFSKIWKT